MSASGQPLRPWLGPEIGLSCSQLEHGVYMAPSQYEAGFTSIAHTEEDVDHTIRAAAEVFKQI